MKKNAMLKIAAILMVAVLLTTCAISSTFAKYTSSDSDTVTARVAKWGVVVDTNIQGLFDSTYAKNDTNFTVANDTVVAQGEYNLVAPGTTKSINVGTYLSGQPEVAISVNTEATLTLTGWVLADGNTEYCPLVFTIAGTDYYIGKQIDESKTISTVAELQTAVKNAIESNGTAMYAANTPLAVADGNAALAYDFEIAWRWDFEKGSDSLYADQSDVNDTYMGNKAVGFPAVGEEGTDGYVAAIPAAPASVTLLITQTINQVD